MIRRAAAVAVRAGAVGLALLVVAGPVVPSAATLPAPAGAAVGPSAASPAQVTLTRVTPIAPQPGDTVTLTGTVRNTSPTLTPLEDLSAILYISSQPVFTRKDFDLYADTPEDFATAGLQPISGATVTLPHPTLAPGAVERWSIAFPLDQLTLQDWEVYKLGVALTSKGSTVGTLQTFLPYASTSTTDRKPLSVSWIWPLADQPHQNVVAGRDVFTDDDLATELGSGGRLSALLNAAATAASQHPPPVRHRRKGTKGPAAPPLPRQAVPVTFAVDPMLLAELQRMAATGGYTVHGPTRTTKGSGRADATGFLSRLKSLLSPSNPAEETVLALPYADPDVVAAVRSNQTEQLGSAYYLGNAVVSKVLGLGEQSPSLLAHWAWPPNGYTDRSTLDALFSLGIETLVLDSTALPVTGEQPTSTPNAHVSVNGRLNSFDGVLTDNTLSQAVTAGAAGDSGLALQRYLAETLMIEAQLPSIPGRSLVIAPSRRWAPDASYATRLLADTGRVPWLQPAPLRAAAQSAVFPSDLTRQLSYPPGQHQLELPGHYVQRVGQLIHQVNQLSAILLPPGAAVVKADDEAVLQALSSAWRDRPLEATAYRSALHRAVVHTLGQVRLAVNPGSLITLTSHSGSVPVTIFNGLSQAVRVGIRLVDTAHRLSITGGQGVRTIPPHQRVAVDVRAKANVSGVFNVYARLMTPGPNSRPLGKQVLLRVRSTAYGFAALAITGAAFAVLLIAVAIRLVRRAVGARHAAAVG